MTITEQIRLKLKTVDEELEQIKALAQESFRGDIQGVARRARRILREICELDGESEE